MSVLQCPAPVHHAAYLLSKTLAAIENVYTNHGIPITAGSLKGSP